MTDIQNAPAQESLIARGERLSHGILRVVDAGAGPPLVLVHGLGGTWRNWQANIPALAVRHRVIAPDLPGFGESNPYHGEVTMERYADTIVELLDVFEIEDAVLVGNSMGGLLTIDTAARHPDRVRAAILVDSSGIPMSSWRKRQIRVARARGFNLIMRSGLAQRAVHGSARVRHAIGGMLVHDPGAVPAEQLAAALGGLGAAGFGAALESLASYDGRVRAADVACPTLVLWGREDRILPAWMGEEFDRLIPDSRLEVWDSIGHCPMLEDPERFDELVAAFLA